MFKVFVVARREYNAAVRTKAFVIGLLMMPILMGGSLLVQQFAGKQRDTRERKVAILDRTAGGMFKDSFRKAIEAYNTNIPLDPKTNEPLRGKIVLAEEDYVTPGAEEEIYQEQRDGFQSRAKKGELMGWLEIGQDVATLPASALEPPTEDARVKYETARLPDEEFVRLAQRLISTQVLEFRSTKLGLSINEVQRVSREVPFETVREGLQVAIFVPLILMMLMFMLILMAATPLMQGVVEEKMQRIAEVLLGSITPFQLMLGKLLGMTAVSLTIAAVYLGGAYWAAHRYGISEFAPASLILWFLFYQTLATLMYGALFIAVGAACTDMRETQNLLSPIMILAVMPMFFFAQVIQAPNGTMVTAISFFPFATPGLMIARQSMPPGVATWQLVVGGLGMLATTLVCVWAAGRIFRVGILMMGKGATPGELFRWVIRG